MGFKNRNISLAGITTESDYLSTLWSCVINTIRHCIVTLCPWFSTFLCCVLLCPGTIANMQIKNFKNYKIYGHLEYYNTLDLIWSFLAGNHVKVWCRCVCSASIWAPLTLLWQNWSSGYTTSLQTGEVEALLPPWSHRHLHGDDGTPTCPTVSCTTPLPPGGLVSSVPWLIPGEGLGEGGVLLPTTSFYLSLPIAARLG